MKSILRLLVASSAMLLVLSPSVLAVPVAQDESAPEVSEGPVEESVDPSRTKGVHAAAGVYGTLECQPEELHFMCTADNVGTRCNQQGVYTPNEVYRERCRRACTCT